MMWYNSVDKKTSVYNTKKAFLARFWYHIFGYDHTPKSVTCAFLASPFFTAGLFLHGITLTYKYLAMSLYVLLLPNTAHLSFTIIICIFSRFFHKIKHFTELWYSRILKLSVARGCAPKPLLLLIQCCCWNPPSKNPGCTPTLV